MRGGDGEGRVASPARKAEPEQVIDPIADRDFERPIAKAEERNLERSEARFNELVASRVAIMDP